MERMTIMTPKGAALKMNDVYPSEDAARAALMEKYRIAVDRLAAYEDTGLDPEEIDSIFVNSVMEENRRLKDELNRIENKPNDPITLEELRKMSWESAWVDGDRETKIGHSGWAIVWYSKVEKYVCVWWPGTEYADIPSLDSYGDTWKAYRCKPEERTE